MKRDILIKLLDSRDLFDLGFDAIDERCDKILEYINQLESDKMEGYKAIVEDNLYIEDGDTWCNKCGGVNDKYVDSEVIHTGINCIVNKAVNYIEEHK
jgi:hypothetical protein